MVIRTLTSLIFLLTFAAAAPPTPNPCSATHVLQNRAVLTVLPTDADDTANLRCAIAYAATLGSGAVVQLLNHSYKTAQLVVSGFHGTIRGAGLNKTILRNTDTPMPVTNPVTWPDSPPSYANPYPALISITGGDVTLSDFTIQIAGQSPVADWFWFGGGPYHFVDPALLVLGSNVNLRAERIEIAGSGKCFPDPDGNLLVALGFGNFAASSAMPWSEGSQVLADNSSFRSCVGVYSSEVRNSVLEIIGSRFDTVRRGIVAGGMSNSRIQISSNQVNASTDSQNYPVAIDLFGGNFGDGFQNATILLSSNRIASGMVGIFLESHTIFGSIACTMVGNNVEHVPDTGFGYWFGEGTYGCTVVGHGKGTVKDDTNGAHTITGVTRHTGGIGQGISGLRKGGKAPMRP